MIPMQNRYLGVEGDVVCVEQQVEKILIVLERVIVQNANIIASIPFNSTMIIKTN